MAASSTSTPIVQYATHRAKAEARRQNREAIIVAYAALVVAMMSLVISIMALAGA